MCMTSDLRSNTIIQELRKSDERKTALATIAMSEAAPDGTLAIRARGQTTQMP
ncbi:hypothetical protein ABBQ38_007918 [Trebouxia sp. C0009 RCD-2024]